MFAQSGIHLPRQTMADWMLRCADGLQVLYDHLRQLLLQQAVIQADETTVKVVNEDKARCYMWVYCTGTDSPTDTGPPNIVLYDYHASRGGQCAVDFLSGFSGHLQVDGYAGYEQTDATLVGCWAHVRRKFMEAKHSQPKGKSGKPDMALSHIQQLYALDKSLSDASPQRKHEQRQKQAPAILDKFKAWLDKASLTTPPKSKLGKAIAYTLNQWDKLTRFLDDGRLTLDNNRAERAIKPFVIARKNWLFSYTAKGAHASAILYSLIETAKANGLTPFDYLHYLFKELPHLNPGDDLDHLLPWNINKG